MHKYAKYTLAFFIGIAAILRIYNLSFQCFWTEEQYTLGLISQSIYGVITTSLYSDVNPPFYYVLAHFFGAREVSAMAGIALIPAMYVLGRYFKNNMVGLYCAGISAVMYSLVYYSQFGRSYALSILLFCFFLISYLAAIRKNCTILPYFGILIFSILLVWTHILNIIPVSFSLIYLFLKGHRKLSVITSIFVSPILLMLTGYSGRTNNISPFGLTPYELLYITPFEFFSTTWYFAFPLAIYGVFLQSKELLPLAVISVLTVIINLILSEYTPVFSRYYLVLILILILAISMSLESFTEHIPEYQQYSVLFMIVSALFFFQFPDFITHYSIQKYSC